MPRLRVITFLLLLTCAANVFSQSYTQSQKTCVINGKKYFLHKVERGQSLYGIAKLYNTDLNTLILENPGAIDGIKHGQELKIPAEKPRPQPTAADLDKYVLHSVARGETIFSITQKYQVTEQQLTQLNPDIKNGLKEGLLLRIKEKPKVVAIASGTSTVTSAVTTASVNPGSDTVSVLPYNKPKKPSYTVGVFLPFSFREAETLNVDELIVNKQLFPPAQQLALDFYEGLQKAADSLKSADFSVTLKVYDVGEKDSMQVYKYAREESFRNLDLIIGPMYNSSFRIISSEARKFQIPCVSPLTQHNKVLFENAYASKTTPSNNSLLSGLATYCLDSLMSHNLVLVNTGYAKDQAAIKYFRLAFNEKAAARGLKDTISEVRGIAGAKTLYKADKLNYFIVLSEYETPVSDFVTHLNMFAEKKENLRVIGLRKWLSLDNLDLEYFNRFGLMFPASYHINYDDALVKKLSAAYRDKFYTDATDHYYYAADLGLYYFEQLRSQGPAFCVQLDKLPKKGPFISYNFFHPNGQTGFENQAVQIIRYTDYKLKRIN
jgi:LysM repeat protein